MFRHLLYLITCTTFGLFAADKKFPVKEIPDELKKNMYAVIREDESDFKILDVNKSSWRVHRVVTILNSNAKRLANEIISYDRQSKI
jgi:hypothetical protein